MSANLFAMYARFLQYASDFWFDAYSCNQVYTKVSFLKFCHFFFKSRQTIIFPLKGLGRPNLPYSPFLMLLNDWPHWLKLKNTFQIDGSAAAFTIVATSDRRLYRQIGCCARLWFKSTWFDVIERQHGYIFACTFRRGMWFWFIYF